MRPTWLHHRNKIVGLLQAAQWLIEDAKSIIVSCPDFDELEGTYDDLLNIDALFEQDIAFVETYIAREKAREEDNK